MRTRRRENVAKTAPLGMYAVVRHMIDHQLPAPLCITAPHYCRSRGEYGSVVVGIESRHHAAWISSIDVDSETIRPSDVVAGYEQVTTEGRLPDSGVRISVHASRRTVPPLQLVAGASS